MKRISQFKYFLSIALAMMMVISLVNLPVHAEETDNVIEAGNDTQIVSAISTANNDLTKNYTIKLTTSGSTVSNAITVNDGCNLTIDTNGKYMSFEGTLTNNGTLNLISSSDNYCFYFTKLENNGTINNNGYMNGRVNNNKAGIINNHVQLKYTARGGYYSSLNDGVINNEQTGTLKGSDKDNYTLNNNGTINNAGQIESNTQIFTIANAGTIDNKGGSIVGDNKVRITGSGHVLSDGELTYYTSETDTAKALVPSSQSISSVSGLKEAITAANDEAGATAFTLVLSEGEYAINDAIEIVKDVDITIKSADNAHPILNFNEGLTNAGSLTVGDSITINASTKANPLINSGSIKNEGTIKEYVNNSGTMTVGETNSSAALICSNSTNTGTMTIYTSLTVNSGATLNNEGKIQFNGDSSTLNNAGTIINEGEFVTDHELTNDGVIKSDAEIANVSNITLKLNVTVKTNDYFKADDTNLLTQRIYPQGTMKDVVLTIADNANYYFPTDYAITVTDSDTKTLTDSGIKVTRDSAKQITISGTLADDVSKDLTITLADPKEKSEGTVTGEDKEVTYDGSTIDVSKLFTDSNKGTYSVDSGSGEGTISGSKLTVTKAGTFVIKKTVATTDDTKEASATATLTIKKASYSDYYQILMDNSASKSAVLIGNDYKMSLSKNTAGNKIASLPSVDDLTVTWTYSKADDTTEIDKPTKAGSYKVYATIAASDLFEETQLSKNFTIAKKDGTVTGEDQDMMYDGGTIDVSKLFTDGNEGTYEIESGTGTGTLSGSALTVTKAGTFVIKKTSAETDETNSATGYATLTVEKFYMYDLFIDGSATKRIIKEGTNYTLAVGVDTNYQEKITQLPDDVEVTLSYTTADDMSKKIDQPTAVGQYYVHVSITGNDLFQSFDTSWYFEIESADAPDATIVYPQAKDLYYTGGYQDLVTAGSIKVGDTDYSDYIEYSSTGEENSYSTAVPTGKDVGTYTVYYKFSKNDKWADAKDGTLTVTIAEASENIGASLYGHSLNLEGKIGVNFYMELSDDIVNDDGAYMLFTLPDESTQKVYVKDVEAKTIDENTYYPFECKMAAKEMTDTIRAQIHLSNGNVGKVYEYTVKEYADYILNNYDSEGLNYYLKLTVRAMLYYGAYSQTYFSHATDHLANEGISDSYIYTEIFNNANAKNLTSYNYSSNLNEAVSFVGGNLVLESGTSMYLYFDSEKTLTFKDSEGDTLTNETRHGYQSVSFENIAAQYLDVARTVEVYDGETLLGTVEYSPLSYCYNVLASEDTTATDDLKNVVKALYQYRTRAVMYFSKKNQS